MCAWWARLTWSVLLQAEEEEEMPAAAGQQGGGTRCFLTLRRTAGLRPRRGRPEKGQCIIRHEPMLRAHGLAFVGILHIIII